MAGLPPMLGFLGKELIYEAKMQLPDVAWLVLPLSVGANIMMVAISITVYYELFFRQKNKAAIPSNTAKGNCLSISWQAPCCLLLRASYWASVPPSSKYR